MDTRGHRGYLETAGHLRDTGGQKRAQGTHWREGTLSKIVVCLCNFYKNVWFKNKYTIFFTNHLG